MKSFNLRVYGLLFNSKNEVLISDERRNGVSFTKFPGGGLEFGEGLSAALKREFQEEIGIEVEVGELFYVNDFLQVSAFNKDHELLSFYYFVNYADCTQIRIEKYTHPLTNEGEKQRWISLSELENTIFTFPLDKIVVEKISKLKIKPFN